MQKIKCHLNILINKANYMNAEKAVEDNLMKMYWQSMRKFVKKYFSQRERLLIQQLRDKFKHRHIANNSQ